jgi:hypothetical protein
MVAAAPPGNKGIGKALKRLRAHKTSVLAKTFALWRRATEFKFEEWSAGSSKRWD